MSFERPEKREYFRFDLANVVDLVTINAATSDKFSGVTINISETGMCLFVFQPVSTNDRISIVKSMLPLGHRAGSVRWVNTMTPEFYKIGLIFDPEEGPSEGLFTVNIRTGNYLHSPANNNHGRRYK
ncbi:MAG: PilZ domain-containing protein [Thermodesulfovibrionales bacterium]